MARTKSYVVVLKRSLILILLFGSVEVFTAFAYARPAPRQGPDVLTLGEAARLLRIAPEELARLAAASRVPGRRIGLAWRFNRSALLAWLNGDWSVITTAVPRSVARAHPASALSSSELGMQRGAGTTLAQTSNETRNRVSATNGGAPIGTAPEERTSEEVFLREQKVLLARGEVAIDLGQFYARSDNRQLAVVGTGAALGTVEQETFSTFLQGRVGLGSETELFASTSWFARESDLFVGSRRIAGSDRSELSDLRLGIRHTLLKESVSRPNVIATLDGRIPTGDTSYAVGGGIALVKSVDPVVLFANANYRHTFSREFADLTRLEPEERLDVTLGYALALNDSLTMSTSVSGLFAGATAFRNASLRQQDSYSLSLGLTSLLAKGLYIEPSVSFGLSGPGNSVAFGVTIPYTF